MFAPYSTSEHVHVLCERQLHAFNAGVYTWDDPWVEALGTASGQQLETQKRAMDLGYPISIYSWNL